tara:strand:- start:3734 stop:5134 length:1401 start_codon:yes stop_codon:yes gene_type:complete
VGRLAGKLGGVAPQDLLPAYRAQLRGQAETRLSTIVQEVTGGEGTWRYGHAVFGAMEDKVTALASLSRSELLGVVAANLEDLTQYADLASEWTDVGRRLTREGASIVSALGTAQELWNAEASLLMAGVDADAVGRSVYDDYMASLPAEVEGVLRRDFGLSGYRRRRVRDAFLPLAEILYRPRAIRAAQAATAGTRRCRDSRRYPAPDAWDLLNPLVYAARRARALAAANRECPRAGRRAATAAFNVPQVRDDLSDLFGTLFLPEPSLAIQEPPVALTQAEIKSSILTQIRGGNVHDFIANFGPNNTMGRASVRGIQLPNGRTAYIRFLFFGSRVSGAQAKAAAGRQPPTPAPGSAVQAYDHHVIVQGPNGQGPSRNFRVYEWGRGWQSRGMVYVANPVRPWSDLETGAAYQEPAWLRRRKAAEARKRAAGATSPRWVAKWGTGGLAPDSEWGLAIPAALLAVFLLR